MKTFEQCVAETKLFYANFEVGGAGYVCKSCAFTCGTKKQGLAHLDSAVHGVNLNEVLGGAR